MCLQPITEPFTHHVDGVDRADAVDKHVGVNHCRFDCKTRKNRNEKTFFSTSVNTSAEDQKLRSNFDIQKASLFIRESQDFEPPRHPWRFWIMKHEELSAGWRFHSKTNKN